MLPKVAQGFRWKILASDSRSERISALEIYDVEFDGIATTVYRDSVAFGLDTCPAGEQVVLNGASSGLGW